ncbi:MAG TPA: transposase [Candidatus Angelobacter sp.]|nr:transposase [Candidatus Angelobacter sp.]
MLKAGSSKWVNESFPARGRFSWQEGYGAFSIGASQRDMKVVYIRRPPEHHKRISFEEEFKRLLAAYGIQEE